MQIEIKKVTLAHFIDAAEALEAVALTASGETGFDLASATVMADLVIDGQEINNVQVHIGGNHIYGGCSPREAMLVVWLDDMEGAAPHEALEAMLGKVDEDDGETYVEEALAADPRIIEIMERIRQEWRKV